MDSIPDLQVDVVSQVLTFTRELGVSSAHYVDNADRILIEGLIGMLGKNGVSIMDMPNRWGGGRRFFLDEFESCSVVYPECPDWLEDIVSYQEGGPQAPYLLIRDSPWDHRLQLRRIVAFHGREERHIPGVAMISNARQVSIPRSFEIVYSSDLITLIRRI